MYVMFYLKFIEFRNVRLTSFCGFLKSMTSMLALAWSSRRCRGRLIRCKNGINARSPMVWSISMGIANIQFGDFWTLSFHDRFCSVSLTKSTVLSILKVHQAVKYVGNVVSNKEIARRRQPEKERGTHHGIWWDPRIPRFICNLNSNLNLGVEIRSSRM